MKIFCAYAFTGEDVDEVRERMRLVVDTLHASGHQAYCNMFDEAVDALQANDDLKGILQEAFKNIARNEVMAAIITSPSKSIGQIMEIGIALSQRKPVYLFEHTSAKNSSYLPRLVDTYFQWETLEELAAALQQIPAK
jgi:hypothetical protein